MSASWRLNQYSRRLCGKSQSQDPLVTGIEPGTFGTRGRRSTFAPLSSTNIICSHDSRWFIPDTSHSKSRQSSFSNPTNAMISLYGLHRLIWINTSRRVHYYNFLVERLIYLYSVLWRIDKSHIK